MVSDGEDAGSSVSGSVKAICRRTGVTGMSTPTISPMLRDQAPAAHDHGVGGDAAVFSHHGGDARRRCSRCR